MTKFIINIAGLLILLGYLGSSNIFSQDTKIPAGWKSVHICHMRFMVPKTLRNHKANGMDSCIGVFSNRRLSLALDFGWYSGVSRRDNHLDFKEVSTEIDGRKGQFATYRDTSITDAKKWVARIFAVVKPANGPESEIGVNMFVWVKSPKDFDTASRIFKSIRFDEDAGTTPY